MRRTCGLWWRAMADNCCRASGFACPACGHGEDGAWVFYTGGTREISLECPRLSCGHEWIVDTEFGKCDRPAGVDGMPVWGSVA